MLGMAATIMAAALYYVSYASPGDLSAVERPRQWTGSIRLSGAFDMSSAGDIVAARAGLFDREGLQLEIHSARSSDDSVKSVLAGIDTIGVADSADFLVKRAQGARIVAFAAAYLESPVVLYALEQARIHAPRDFIGKRIGYQPGRVTAMIYEALMAKLGLSRTGVREVALAADAPPFSDNVDVWPDLITVHGYSLRQQGVRHTMVRPASYGIHVPGTVYFATEKTVRENAEFLRRFLRAAIAGWDLVLSDREKSIALIAGELRAPPPMIGFNLDEQRDFVRPPGRRIAEFDDQQWRSLREILMQQRLITEPVVISEAVTFEFVREAYRKSGAYGR